jgi:transcriptional regulator with XRE-family HTH domain
MQAKPHGGSMSKTGKRPLASIFGSIISEKRILLGMSQEDLAEKVGITQVALSRMEKGLISPRFERLQSFAVALGCSVSELFPRADRTKDRADTIADIIQVLTSDQQTEIMNVMIILVRMITHRENSAIMR